MKTLGLILVTLIAFTACDKAPPANKPSGNPTSNGKPPTWNPSGNLSPKDTDDWHHLAEGSEIFPRDWFFALERKDSDALFTDDLNRFGLLPDAPSANNPDGLPIGITTTVSRDLKFANVQMIGVNCAACHTNELHLDGRTVLQMDGAPNLFDLRSFYAELIEAALANFTHPDKLLRFLQRLSQKSSVKNAALASDLVVEQPNILFDQLSSFTDLKKGDKFEKALSDELEKVMKRELERQVQPEELALVTQSDDPALQRYRSVLKDVGDNNFKLNAPDVEKAAKNLRKSVLGNFAAPVLEDTDDSANSLSIFEGVPLVARLQLSFKFWDDVATTLRLLKARVQMLIQLATTKEETTLPGFGRVDAFGSARNTFFPHDTKPLTSPVSYPHVWSFGRTDWLHWDGNTRSVTERNAGQAVGLLAVYDSKTFDSTLLIHNIEKLEDIGRTLKPPKWPFPVTPEQIALAKQGTEIYNKLCIGCHAIVPDGQRITDANAPLIALDKIGTDQRRALNFAQPVNGEEFDVALSRALKQLVLKAGGTSPTEKLWRIKGEYAARPLIAPWATAPYLHNNSVRTLAELLKPAAEREKTFFVGSREYDTKDLGFRSVDDGTTMKFESNQTGNNNSGHEGEAYGTTLKSEEKTALLEYLKTL